MNIKSNREDEVEGKRKSKRFTTNLKAQYFLGESKGNGKECTVINVSGNGAGLEFYTHDKIGISTDLNLKIFAPKATDPINVKGILRWVKQGEKDFVGGVEVVLESDKEKLAVLIEFILGL
ncbi:MAG: PilZ domain-containing protein [Deltaproteobacteria bacterium]|nr:PilZ domain-containing protein [Deltaproteobacteria bacterium]